MEKSNHRLNSSEDGNQDVQPSLLQNSPEVAQETPQETARGVYMAISPQHVVLDSVQEPVQQTLQEDSHRNATATSQDEVSCPGSNQPSSRVLTVSAWVELPNHTGNPEHGQASENFPIKVEPVDSASDSESESEPEGRGGSDPDFEGSDDEGASSDGELRTTTANGRPIRPRVTAQRSTRDGRPQRASAMNERHDDDISDDAGSRRRLRRRARQVVNIEISQEDKEISLELGLRRLYPENPLTPRLYPVASDEDDDTDEFQMDDETAFPADNGGDDDWFNDVEGFLNELTVIDGARKSALQPAIPSSAHKNKRNGLREIARKAIAANPAANRREVRKDSRSIERAARLLTHRPHLDGTGQWEMDGMKSSLYHYQVQGIGWMRKRERSHDPIRGGMLCDVMGLGKTLTALTTIFDGRSEDRNKLRAPTLIIVPPHLVSIWRNELVNHFQKAKFGVVQYYTKEMDEEFDRDLSGLGLIAVVIATYEDVRRSYPPLKIPKDLQTGVSKEAITSWWLAHYDESVGLLHKVRWHRIVIDEGHTIRNEKAQVSVAVRALIGGPRWILTGTPLHNSIDDFFPYFNFLKVPRSATIEQFKSRYCQGGPQAKARLIATMRPFFKRRTYESTLFGLQILSMHGLKEEDVFVNFCQAETLIYDTIVRTFREKVNDLESWTAEQRSCILNLMIMLRLFSSHPLTAQAIVQRVLNGQDIFANLADTEGGDSQADCASAEIKRFFNFAKNKPRDRIAPIRTLQSEVAKRTSVGERGRLLRNFRQTDEKPKQQCKGCGEHLSLEIVLTQCAHLYHGGCFNMLDENAAGIPRCKCGDPIAEAVALGAVEELHLDESLFSASSGTKRKSTRRGWTRRQRMTSCSSSNLEDDGSDMLFNEEDDLNKDLIPLLQEFQVGATLLGSKLTKARDLIRGWVQESSDNKILVFTHFLPTMRLLEWMCDNEGLSYTQLSGQLPIPVRNREIAKFQKSKEVKVMLSTITTGGTGINLTAANKCILFDPWWNVAMEDQANCRVFRIGQTRDVHCVKLIARGAREAELTIDQQMLAMQQEKMKNIQGVIGSQTLSKPIEQVLQCLGHVTKTKNGGYRITKVPPAQNTPEAS